MSTELRVKKLRGSGGYIMAAVTDTQQTKGNLGGPDLFLAPIGRLDSEKISKHFCNTCEKESKGAPKIEFENPNEEVADNLILAERGQYKCNECNGTIAEYREFKKKDDSEGIGHAKPLEAVNESPKIEKPAEVVQAQQPKTDTVTSVSSIEGRGVYDEEAKKIGTAKQVGIDSNQSMVLVIVKKDGTKGSIPWNTINKVGDIILLGNPKESMPGKCSECGFDNKKDSKFCEECGNKI